MRWTLLVVVAACSSGEVTSTPSSPSVTPAPAPRPTGKPLPGIVTWAPLPAEPPFLAARVRSSGPHRCAVARDGRVACWGDLGGSPFLHTGVAHLLGGIDDAIDVAFFVGHVCVVRRDTTGGCIPITGESTVPAFPGPAVELAQAGGALCVRDSTGGIACHDMMHKTPFAPIAGIAAATSLTCDAARCCATTSTGVRCFEGPAPHAAIATQVLQPDQSCVVHPDGSASCSGGSMSGELGDGRPTFFTTPQRVPDLTDIVDLRVTETQACAIARDRSATCWGWASRTRIPTTSGLLGSGDEPACWIAGRTLNCHQAEHQKPVPLVPRTAALAIRSAIKTFATSGSAICAVDGAGKLSCTHDWEAEQPWLRIPGAPVAEVHEYGEGFCARLVDGRVGCFAAAFEPANAAMSFVDGITDAIQLTSGAWGACVLTRSRDVECWTDRESLPRPITGLQGATTISTRGMHVCGIVRGEAWCSGFNGLGQLGDGTRVDPPDGAAVRVTAAFKPVKIGVAGQATCALDDRGQVWCWGSDQHGELGQGRSWHADLPTRVAGLGPR